MHKKNIFLVLTGICLFFFQAPQYQLERFCLITTFEFKTCPCSYLDQTKAAQEENKSRNTSYWYIKKKIAKIFQEGGERFNSILGVRGVFQNVFMCVDREL